MVGGEWWSAGMASTCWALAPSRRIEEVVANIKKINQKWVSAARGRSLPFW
jgi:hypothetical protein